MASAQEWQLLGALELFAIEELKGVKGFLANKIMFVKFNKVKRRRDYLAINNSLFYCHSEFFLLKAKQRDKNNLEPSDIPRLGFTVTKKLGKAVVRNKCKRQLKEASRLINVFYILKDFDYVLIAKKGMLTAKFSDLIKELERAFSTITSRIRRYRSSPTYKAEEIKKFNFDQFLSDQQDSLGSLSNYRKNNG